MNSIVVTPWHAVDNALLSDCARLFCAHYGAWRDRQRGRVRLSAMERVIGRSCDPALIVQRAPELLFDCAVEYARGRKTDGARINTEFDVDHAEVHKAREATPDWALGELPDGCEYFGFVFSPDQRRMA